VFARQSQATDFPPIVEEIHHLHLVPYFSRDDHPIFKVYLIRKYILLFIRKLCYLDNPALSR
jgi:hypothetical protein